MPVSRGGVNSGAVRSPQRNHVRCCVPVSGAHLGHVKSSLGDRLVGCFVLFLTAMDGQATHPADKPRSTQPPVAS